MYGQRYIRGIGSGLTARGTESSIAPYVDGVYQACQYALVQILNNIERIEIFWSVISTA
jgi:iron complex outermembrane recepter protein